MSCALIIHANKLNEYLYVLPGIMGQQSGIKKPLNVAGGAVVLFPPSTMKPEVVAGGSPFVPGLANNPLVIDTAAKQQVIAPSNQQNVQSPTGTAIQQLLGNQTLMNELKNVLPFLQQMNGKNGGNTMPKSASGSGVAQISSTGIQEISIGASQVSADSNIASVDTKLPMGINTVSKEINTIPAPATNPQPNLPILEIENPPTLTAEEQQIYQQLLTMNDAQVSRFLDMMGQQPSAAPLIQKLNTILSIGQTAMPQQTTTPVPKQTTTTTPKPVESIQNKQLELMMKQLLATRTEQAAMKKQMEKQAQEAAKLAEQVRKAKEETERQKRLVQEARKLMSQQQQTLQAKTSQQQQILQAKTLSVSQQRKLPPAQQKPVTPRPMTAFEKAAKQTQLLQLQSKQKKVMQSKQNKVMQKPKQQSVMQKPKQTMQNPMSQFEQAVKKIQQANQNNQKTKTFEETLKQLQSKMSSKQQNQQIKQDMSLQSLIRNKGPRQQQLIKNIMNQQSKQNVKQAQTPNVAQSRKPPPSNSAKWNPGNLQFQSNTLNVAPPRPKPSTNKPSTAQRSFSAKPGVNRQSLNMPGPNIIQANQPTRIEQGPGYRVESVQTIRQRTNLQQSVQLPKSQEQAMQQMRELAKKQGQEPIADFRSMLDKLKLHLKKTQDQKNNAGISLTVDKSSNFIIPNNQIPNNQIPNIQIPATLPPPPPTTPAPIVLTTPFKPVTTAPFWDSFFNFEITTPFPGKKRGTCPVASTVVMSCNSICTRDSECGGRQKCCHSGNNIGCCSDPETMSASQNKMLMRLMMQESGRGGRGGRRGGRGGGGWGMGMGMGGMGMGGEGGGMGMGGGEGGGMGMWGGGEGMGMGRGMGMGMGMGAQGEMPGM